MFYSDTVAVYSEIDTKSIDTLGGQNVAVANIQVCGTYSNHATSSG
jgi:hypothetical protein